MLNPVAARRASHSILLPPSVNTQSANMSTETRNSLLGNIDRMKAHILAWTGSTEASDDSYNQRAW